MHCTLRRDPRVYFRPFVNLKPAVNILRVDQICVQSEPVTDRRAIERTQALSDILPFAIATCTRLASVATSSDIVA